MDNRLLSESDYSVYSQDLGVKEIGPRTGPEKARSKPADWIVFPELNLFLAEASAKLLAYILLGAHE